MELIAKEYAYEISGKKLKIALGPFAFQTNASLIVTYGETSLLVNVVMSKRQREGLDFFPLVVNMEEKLYAAGKIPGGFIKREGRPSDPSIISSRMIDRPIRPLFNQDMRNEVQITIMVLSADQENPPDMPALVGAAAALHISDIPFEGPLGGVRVGFVDDKLVLNPTFSQLEKSPMSMVLAGRKDHIQLVEFEGDEISAEKVYEAAELAVKTNNGLCDLFEQMRSEIGKEKAEAIILDPPDEELVEKTRVAAESRLPRIYEAKSKKERDAIMDSIEEEVMVEILGEKPEELGLEEKMGRDTGEKSIKSILYTHYKNFVRKGVLDNGKRIDGRTPDDIREIWGVVGQIPRVHGSAVFTRGETQGLTFVTLGAIGDQQKVDDIHVIERKRYMHQYNGLPFCYGETGFIRGPGRREIGHGMLAEKALKPMMPTEDDFPYTIRLVTEILSSNGSTSMAATCGSSLSLMDAGVPIKRSVSGIAMGLITDEGGRSVILKDIMGIEDFFGDMDFKVAGTTEGITAIQLDLKIRGLSLELFKEALARADEGRAYILDKMNEVIDKPREDLSPYAPRIFTMIIPVDRIGDVIGPGGKTIRGIIEECGVEIDINDDGRVFITSHDSEGAASARARVEELTQDIEVDKVYTGKVVKIMSFGAFVEVIPGKDGLLHVSQIGGKRRINNVEDAVQIGDMLKILVYEIDDQGRINLTRRGITDDPFEAILEERMDKAYSGGGGGSDRGGSDRRGGSGGRSNRRDGGGRDNRR